jgi:hypothetical protein
LLESLWCPYVLFLCALSQVPKRRSDPGRLSIVQCGRSSRWRVGRSSHFFKVNAAVLTKSL